MTTTHDSSPLELHLGPIRVFVHSLFFHAQRFKALSRVDHPGPWIERSSTFEDDPPYRTGESFIVRIPGLRVGVVVGYWDLPEEGRTQPAFMDDFIAPVTSIHEWRRPTEVTDTTGTAFEDTPERPVESKFVITRWEDQENG